MAATAGPIGQPDIAYAPRLDNYQARTARRIQTETLPQTLPEGFPDKLDSDLVWDGNTLGESYDWNYHLTAADLAEVDAALKHFQSLNKPLAEINQETFPLPTLHATLRGISHEIHNGHGFKVVRGIPVDKYTREQNVIIYTGVSSHVAPIRGRQDNTWQGKPADVILAHIKDLSRKVDAKHIGAPVYTAEKQVFHTDSGDVIGLFALSESAEGGESYLASAGKVYNELAETRPDLIHTLAEDWAFDEFSKEGDAYLSRPLLYHSPATDTSPARFIIQYARRNFTGYWGYPRSPNIPPITEAQAEALDALHFLSEKYAVALDFHKGDIQYANNLSIFHARGAFSDTEEKQRHLLRLWLRDPEFEWEKHPALKGRFDRVYAGLEVEKSIFPLEATIRGLEVGT
ncbi:hypothetical protein ASPWEDRAFT_119128 [Aspergillus wentii DTO 134E9]|uniref:TauD/TfdA-like domain-containing protein n=1 Tax=Aspergillus wentii DTO 134E9 TaxID=1073089 RepID=A0A1L9R8L9_ASPWE|nr:uncharacterized protein ASPWEDRAFT_119128 [Aspergillus wentii DTO 134E9]KAI9925081.1 hypothetical protein MW887_006489 [Aspergillus wentii]OJJ31259.1 hypothetical protein ASPWEDRAFT_119128 [Aspergillus wentii DTO 134E9]